MEASATGRASVRRLLVYVGLSLSAVVPRLASPAPGTAGVAAVPGAGDASHGTDLPCARIAGARHDDATRGTGPLPAPIARVWGDSARAAPIWPLRAGARYDWRGEVAWTPPGTQDTIRRAAQWTTTVHTVVERGGRLVAVVEGLPQAMLLARGRVEPRFGVVASDASRLWVREAASRADADSTARAWAGGEAPGDDVLLLRLPARVGDRWPDQPMKVADGFFEWTVTPVADVRAAGATAHAAPGARAYEVTMHTAPEMRVVTIVPGSGIVRWWHLGFGRTQRVVLELAGIRAPGAARRARAL